VIARSGADRTGTYPEVARALAHLPLESFVIDGEIVALDETGRSSFELVQRRFTQTDPSAIEQVRAEVPVLLYAFDALEILGHDVRRLPLLERKGLLARFAPRLGQVRFADHVEGDGESLFAAAEQHRLEGIVAKRADSRYESDRRSSSWVKVKVPRSAHLVIVGHAEGKGSRRELGSVALAWYRDGELVYAGNAGSGLDEATIRELVPRLAELASVEPTCEGAPQSGSRRVLYARPELVCRVRFTEVTSAGLLRHPVFEALVPNLEPGECTAPNPSAGGPVAEEPELPTPAAPRPERLELTRLDKVFWPVEGYTKGDLLAYYEAIWPWLAPYLRDRPLVLTRYPDGIEGKSFYQKNAPEFTPDWVEREVIEGTDYFICNELRELLYVINSGAIPLHVWSSRRDDLEHPDWLILDLDPKEAPFAHVIEIARHIHRLLDLLGAPHFVKTSGQDGLHVLVPLGAQLDHREARSLGEVLARTVVAELPEIATVARPVAARADRVYLDFLQNGRGKLIAAPFSVRPRPHAPVSTPLTWRQVGARLSPERWTIRTTPQKMKRSGDPMAELFEQVVDVGRLLEGLDEHLSAAVAE
jgi:bifunctional non-homologous end joining protein LigD